MPRVLRLALIIALLCSSFLVSPAAQPVQASATAVQDTPTPLVGSGVTSYALTAPKVFWYTGVPQCPPKAAAASADTPATTTAPDFVESIHRIATYGSMTRQLYAENRLCNNGQIRSNLTADADFLYWLQSDGLYKLSTNANPGDPAQLVNALVKAPGEVVDGGDRIYLIYTDAVSNNTKVGYVLKSNKELVPLSTPGNSARKLSFDGAYIYYLVVRQPGAVESGQG